MAHARGGGKTWPKEIRAQVQAEFLLGNSETFLSRKFKVPLATVSYWCRHIPIKDLEALREKTRTNYAELLLSCVECGAETFKVICESAREKSYIQKQDIGQVAVFTGVIADKVFAILEAMEPDPESYSDHESQGSTDQVHRSGVSETIN